MTLGRYDVSMVVCLGLGCIMVGTHRARGTFVGQQFRPIACPGSTTRLYAGEPRLESGNQEGIEDEGNQMASTSKLVRNGLDIKGPHWRMVKSSAPPAAIPELRSAHGDIVQST